jgi:hypothetical protein
MEPPSNMSLVRFGIKKHSQTTEENGPIAGYRSFIAGYAKTGSS